MNLERMLKILNEEVKRGKMIFVGELYKSESVTVEVERITKKPFSSYSSLFMIPAQRNASEEYITNMVYALLK